MKIGNISQTLSKVPHFFLNQEIRNLEAFKINQKRKQYRENDLLQSMKEMNFNNNFRNIHRRFFVESDVDIIKPLIHLNFKSKPLINYFQAKRNSTYGRNGQRALDDQMMHESSHNKFSCKTFNKTDQLQCSNRHQTNNNKKPQAFSCLNKVKLNDALSVKNPHSRIRLKKVNSEVILRPDNKIKPFSYEDMFKQTLMNKVMSMKMISNKIKNAIATKHSIMKDSYMYNTIEKNKNQI